jgi:BirA family biotin operon repressor/biotin-[acetyl-CoA-carboxylase] ligase
MVLGLGVNLNLDAQVLATIDQPATSLALLTGMPVDVAAFRDALLQDFFMGYDEFLGRGFGMIRDEYLARCAFLGTQVEIHQGNETIRGLANSVTLDGTLEIITAHGDTRLIDLGEML